MSEFTEHNKEAGRNVLDDFRASGGRPLPLRALSCSAGGGFIAPPDPGDGGYDGVKFRDLVWVPDKEKVWRAARKVPGRECTSPRQKRLSPSSDGVLVHRPGGEVPVEVPRGETHAYDPSHALDLDDASKMNQMHEAPLLDLLLRRFRQDIIYTNVADVLISVNPYKNVPLLYEVPLQKIQDDRTDTFEESDGENEDAVEEEGTIGDLGSEWDPRPTALRNKLSKPHVFSVADRAFRYMVSPAKEYTHGKRRGKNQSIIITGESGAGKTEASKHVMRYLITVSQLTTGSVRDVAGASKGSSTGKAKAIEDALLMGNTVLEAFGNAKTVRNDNSSRFGKYIKLLYDKELRLVGARTDHFLLEKSRVVKVDHGERGYHIFYQLLAGLDQQRAAGLFLGPPEDFHSTSQGDCVAISDEVDDAQEFSITDEAMDTLGFGQADKAAVFRVLAALLHLGNVSFEEIDSPGQGMAKAKMSMQAAGGGAYVSLDQTARLLGLNEDDLVRKVTWRAMMARNRSIHEIALTARESSDNLSALSKHAYGMLFSWIVAFINRCHDQHLGDANMQSRKEGSRGGGMESLGNLGKGGGGEGKTGEEGGRESFIGILDIFGFEIMATNSFEQLCINFANEVLQRQFNHHIFVLEQEAYRAEGLDVAVIPFRNNQAVIDLISKKPLGLMIILEDQVLTGRKAHVRNKLDDRSVLDLYHQEHHRRNAHPNYEKPRMQCDNFILKHFAGRVTYGIAGFLEKNNDSLQDDLRALLLDSEDPFVRLLAESNTAEEQASTLSPSPIVRGGGGGSNGGRSEAAVVAGSPPTPPPNHSSPGRLIRQRSERDARLANAATVSSRFRRQLDDLVTSLGVTEPHYIKCIKPNSGKAPGGWSSPLVIEQLRYSGVLEVVRIRREAYPLRIGFSEMCRRFRCLVAFKPGKKTTPEACSDREAREMCPKICLAALEPGEFQMGKTKIFLKDDALDKLRWALQARYVSAACRIQSLWRTRADRVRKVRQDASALTLQTTARAFVARRRCDRLVVERRELRNREIRRARDAGQIAMARITRGFLAKRELEKKTAAATVLQAAWRGYHVRTAFQASKAAKRQLDTRRATKLQAWVRMVLAGQARGRARRASTTISAAWRSRTAVTTKNRTVSGVIKFQALARRMLARRGYVRTRSRIIRIQAILRGFPKRSVFVRYVLAARRLQVCIRSWLRNKDLYNIVTEMFAAARRGDVREVTRHVAWWPQLLFVRDHLGGSSVEGTGQEEGKGEDAESPRPRPLYSTLLHAACESGAMDMVALLEPFPEDVTARDRDGNSSLHVAASAANYEMVKYLATRDNTDMERVLKQERDRTEKANFVSTRKASSSVSVFRAARLEHIRWRSETSASAKAAAARTKSSGEPAPKGKHTIMSGYLRKRRETDRWLKRWCVLTETTLVYYHKATDANPSKIINLDKAMLKKSEKVDFAFEIHAPDLMDQKNTQGRLYFACSGEGELQRWMVPLKVVVALYQFRNDKRREPIVYLNSGRRTELMSMANNKGDTPLHVVAGTSLVRFGMASQNWEDGALSIIGDEDTNRPLSRIESGTVTPRSADVPRQRLISWLIENGADPNATDESGQTPLHVAVDSGNIGAADTLARKGGDLSAKRLSDGRSVIMLIMEQGHGMEVLNQVCSKGMTSFPLLPAPKKLFGFTYVSFFIEKTTFSTGIQATGTNAATTTAAVGRGTFGFTRIGGGFGTKGFGLGGGRRGYMGGDTGNPSSPTTMAVGRAADAMYFVRVSVYNAKGKLTEAQQDVVLPAMASRDHLWWAHTWHMQTPLETLGAGSFVSFELKEKGERKDRTLSWGVYHLNPDEVNTRPESLCAYAGVPPALIPSEPSEFTLVGEAIITKVTTGTLSSNCSQSVLVEK